MYSLLVTNLIMPFVMILTGYMLKKHPVQDMKSGNGYNTSVSRRTQAHWDYAQSIAPGIFISLGKVLGVIEIVLSLVMFIFHVPVRASLITGNFAGIAFLFLGFYKTDSEIKKKFTDK
ncbi:MAG: hypothetical protein HFH68_02505 [Lachnospiraceae bacterium]|nr:hypothetical protein [Lachnospiraceae bacterium]